MEYAAGQVDEITNVINSTNNKVTIKILKPFELTNGFGSKQSVMKDVVVDGNNVVLENAKSPLFVQVYSADVSISNLTIQNATISGVSANSMQMAAGFVGSYNGGASTLELNGCVIKDSVIGDSNTKFAAGLVAAKYDSMNVVLKDCKVENCTITSSDNAGGLIGTSQVIGDVTITDCKVVDSEITAGYKNNAWRSGVVIGQIHGVTTTVSNFIQSGNTLATGKYKIALGDGYDGVDFLYAYFIGTGVLDIDDETIVNDGNDASWNVFPKSAVKPQFNEEKNVVVTKDKPLTVPAGVTLNGDITLTEEGAIFTLEAGAVYNGTLNYDFEDSKEVKQKGSAVFKNLKAAGDNGITIKAGSLTISGTIDASEPVEITAAGEIKISGEVVDTSSGSVTTSGGLTITSDGGEGTTVTVVNTLTVGEGATLTVAPGATLDVQGTVSGSGTVAVEGTLNNNGTVGSDVAVTVEEGATIGGTNASDIPNVTYADGAVKTVIIAGGEIADAKYGVQQKVEVTADTTVTGDLEISGVLHVNPGVTLTIASTGSVIIKGAGTSVIEGKLVLEAGDDDTVNTDDASLTVDGTATLQIKGDLSVAGDVTVNKNAEIQFMAGSAAIVGGTFKAANAIIDDSAFLTIAGAIAKNDGTSVEFEVSGTLVISTGCISDSFKVVLGSAKAVLDVEKIVMKNGGEIKVTDKGKVTYADAQDKTGKSEETYKNTVTITLGALSEVESSDSGSAGTTPTTGDDSADESGTFQMVVDNGTSKKVYNIATLTGLKVSETMEPKDASGTALATDTYTMVIGGSIAVVGDVDYDGLGTVKDVVPSAKIVVEGNTAASIGEAVLGTHVSLGTKGKGSVDGAVSLATGSSTSAGDNAKFSNSGKLTVNAAIGAATVAGAFTNSGEITMAGAGSIAVVSSLGGTINGAEYKVSATSTVWYYVTVDTAIAELNKGTATAVTLHGDNVLNESATIPAKASVVFNAVADTLSIGENSESTEVVLTVADGAELGKSTTGIITVNGTLYAEKIKNVGTNVRTEIVSDVYSYALTDKGKQDNNSWAKWTNLVVALNEAEAGQKVVVSSTATALKLGVSAAVKEGVTLDMNGKTLKIAKNIVLTVAGTLDLTDGAEVVLADSEVSSTVTVKNTGKVDVAGGSIVYDYSAADVPVVMAEGAVNVTEVVLPGAYYSKTVSGSQYRYYTTYANGAADVLDADGREVVFDADGAKEGIVLSDLAVSGEKDKAVKITVKSDLTARSITLSYATVAVDDGKKVSATFTDAAGSIAVKAKSGGFTVGDAAVGEAGVLTVSGILNNMDAGKDDSSAKIVGAVYVIGDLTVGADLFDVTGDLTVYGVPGTTVKAVTVNVSEKMTVDGSVSVQNGSILIVGTAVVSGTLSVVSGKAEITTLELSGTVSAVAEKEGATALVVVDRMYAGITEKAVTGADAAVTGEVSINSSEGYYYAVVKGVSVPEAWTSGNGAYRSTVYSVNGVEYATVYAPQASTALVAVVKKAVVENAYVEGWQNADGKIAVGADVTGDETHEQAKIGMDGWKAVSAKVDTEVFTVKITADGGINYVTVGGKILTENDGKLVIDKLTAGTYDVVVSPKAGYDTSKVVIYDEKGEKIDGMKITVSGTPESSAGVTLEYSIVGSTAAAVSGGSSGGMSHDDAQGIIDAIDKNTDAVKNQPAGAAADNSLTNILLIVLVVLIVIMAALVAMRMMRS